MIRTFFRLPFGLWGFCEFPSLTANSTIIGKIRNGGDLLVWVGRLEFVFGREHRGRNLSCLPFEDKHDDQRLGLRHWNPSSSHR